MSIYCKGRGWFQLVEGVGDFLVTWFSFLFVDIDIQVLVIMYLQIFLHSCINTMGVSIFTPKVGQGWFQPVVVGYLCLMTITWTMKWC